MKVILDIDGVLANFNKRAVEALGYEWATHKQMVDRWNWYDNFGLTFAELDSVCSIDFWNGVQWMPDGKDILQCLEQIFTPKNIYLCTTPMPNPGSGTGKMMWVERHLSKYKKRLLISTATKSLLACGQHGPNVLIDDKNENVEEFVMAGGKAVLIPRPWNKSANLQELGSVAAIEDIFQRSA